MWRSKKQSSLPADETAVAVPEAAAATATTDAATPTALHPYQTQAVGVAKTHGSVAVFIATELKKLRDNSPLYEKICKDKDEFKKFYAGVLARANESAIKITQEFHCAFVSMCKDIMPALHGVETMLLAVFKSTPMGKASEMADAAVMRLMGNS